MSITSRIGEFINNQGISMRAFEKSIGASDGMIRRALSNGTDISSKWTTCIADNYPRINVEWLITGNGEMLKNAGVNAGINAGITLQNEEKTPTSRLLYDRGGGSLNEVSDNPSLYQLREDYFKQDKQLIPLYEIDAAAGLSTPFSNQSQQVPIDFIDVPNAPKCDGALYVRGDSMYPILKAGDIAAYKMIENFHNVRFGEIYLLDIDDGDDQYLTIKYIQKSDINDDYFKLVSQNPGHNPKEEKRSNIRMMAIVKFWIRYNTIS
ncbi:MAG: S24 family peptidase [Prevotella sp.]|jgi:phage repressor protein C with HTH and peptisase S24 domain|nr:S24 family peptidase [Prevotella sp.]